MKKAWKITETTPFTKIIQKKGYFLPLAPNKLK